MVLFGVLPSVTCQYFGVTEEFRYSLILAMRLTVQRTCKRLTTRPVDGEPHGTGDDSTARDVPLFRRNGGDPIDCDLRNVDLALYLHSDTSFDVALTKRMSRL
jgi:hypothetical protein